MVRFFIRMVWNAFVWTEVVTVSYLGMWLFSVNTPVLGFEGRSLRLDRAVFSLGHGTPIIDKDRLRVDHDKPTCCNGAN
jgi:hypothetical protein